MKSLFCYIAECSDGFLYTGVCHNVERRMAEHNQGMDSKSFTYPRRPVRFLWTEEFQDPNDAIAAEKQIKGWSRRKKFALINGDFSALQHHAKSTATLRQAQDDRKQEAQSKLSPHLTCNPSVTNPTDHVTPVTMSLSKGDQQPRPENSRITTPVILSLSKGDTRRAS